MTGALLLFAAALPTAAQVFTNTTSGLRRVYESAAVAGDFDNDGKMDLLYDGIGTDGQTTTSVWRNLGNGTFGDFAELNLFFTGVAYGSVAAGDLYNTGRLDGIVTGVGPGPAPVTQLWHNLGSGNFTFITNSALPAMANDWVAVGDFDNDGRLDVLISGYTNVNRVGVPRSRVCSNLGNGIFSASSAGITGNGTGPVFACDFDNDGYLDVLIGSKMWKNLGNGSFTNLNSGLPANALAVGDFDNDGYMDVVTLNGSVFEVWRNLGNGTFTNYGSVTVTHGMLAAVGDYDNDGYLDLLLATYTANTNTVQVWRNLHNGQFTNAASVSGAVFGSLTWGDFNNDGLLDFFVTGQNGIDQNNNPILVAQIWQNSSGVSSSSPPTAPTNLTAQIKGHGGVQLNWGAATDDHTPTAGLNYNIRVGTTPSGLDIVSPEANPLTGQRLVVQIGNAQERLFSLLTNLTGGTYYWSVQAIDTAFAGGAFATESTFVIPPTINGFIYTNGQFQVAFNALATNSYTLQGSTNLSAWIALTNIITATNGPAQLSDTNTASFPLRYYRLSCP